MSGGIAPKIIPGYVDIMQNIARQVNRPSRDKCHELAGLLSEAFDRNKTPFALSDRHAIMDYAIRGSWATVRLKLELGQAKLPKEDVDLLLGAMTLLE